ncbi:MAG: VOC family protein [Sphingomonadales bacterium]|nr:VOC family protein [Sphingomonadales bacterium]
MNSPDNVVVSHIGICTSDLERSTRFYTEALGFEVERHVDIGPPFDLMTEVPGLKGRAGFFRRGDVRIELAAYESPDVLGPAERRPMNQLGITHLSFVVGDLEAVTQRIAALGGRVLSETRVVSPHGALMFCTDPDGIRLELWEKVGAGF